jgi:hypothetical protein
VVLEGMPNFLKEQLDNEAIDLDALRDRITTDPRLCPNRRKRGEYLALGRSVDTHQMHSLAEKYKRCTGSDQVNDLRLHLSTPRLSFGGTPDVIQHIS